MIFRGSYEVTRQLKGQDVEATKKVTTVDLAVNGNIDVKTGSVVNMGLNKITNVLTPAVATDAATKGYIDSSVRHIITGIDVPMSVLGKNEDLYFRGTRGGVRALTGITGGNVTDLSSDSQTIIVSTDAPTGQYYESTNSGISWTVRAAIADKANPYRFAVSTGVGKFILIRKRFGTGFSAPSYSDDSGKTWQGATVPAMVPANVNAILVDKDNANPKLVMLLDSGKPLYSLDNGKTWAVSNAPANNYTIGSMNDSTVIIMTQSGTCYTSKDGGVNFTVQGTLPALSITWTTMLAIDAHTYICAGTGTDSRKVAYSYNAGTNWVEKLVLPAPVQAIDMISNRISGNIALVGNTGLVYYANISNIEKWNVAGTNNPSHISRDIDTFGAGFVGVSYGPSPVVSMTDDGTYWSTETNPEFLELYTKVDGNWINLDVMQQRSADARYLRAIGGVINGPLGMNNHNISGISDPVNPQDAVTLRYLQNQMSAISGTFKPATVGTTNTVADTVDKDVETFKYIISAKNGNARYYSEMNVVANGVDAPQSAEYSVMSIGGLDITSSVTKAANGDTELRIQSSLANTIIYLKRVIIDF